eukprot:5259410-Karenia_brevis.AAC.1
MDPWELSSSISKVCKVGSSLTPQEAEQLPKVAEAVKLRLQEKATALLKESQRVPVLYFYTSDATPKRIKIT